MAQRGYELATELYILNHVYKDSKVIDIVANAARCISVHV